MTQKRKATCFLFLENQQLRSSEGTMPCSPNKIILSYSKQGSEMFYKFPQQGRVSGQALTEKPSSKHHHQWSSGLCPASPHSHNSTQGLCVPGHIKGNQCLRLEVLWGRSLKKPYRYPQPGFAHFCIFKHPQKARCTLWANVMSELVYCLQGCLAKWVEIQSMAMLCDHSSQFPNLISLASILSFLSSSLFTLAVPSSKKFAFHGILRESRSRWQRGLWHLQPKHARKLWRSAGWWAHSSQSSTEPHLGPLELCPLLY